LSTIVLALSSDNEKIRGGQFITRGVTKFKELKFSANFIWENSPPNVILSVNIPTLNVFSFEEGGLVSDFVPSANIVHSFHKTGCGSLVLAEERNELGIGDFSARMICQVSSTSDGRKGVIIKFAILLFPAAAEELADIPEAKHAGWPGILAYEGTFPLVPKPTVPWQCPIVPFLLPGVPFAELDTAPPSGRIRFAVSAVMRKTAQPEALENGGQVVAKWRQIRINPRELVYKEATTTWPVVDPIPEPDGKRLHFLSLHSPVNS